MKKTIVSAVINAEYVFTGADRDAAFAPSSDAELSFVVLNKGQGEKDVSFLRKNSLHVVRARLVPNGAPGLQVANGRNAADLLFEVVEDGDAIASFGLAFSKWDEWEEKDLYISLVEWSNPFNITINDSSVMRCDDFNVQTAYVGETLYPVLELEIESEGDALVDEDGRVY